MYLGTCRVAVSVSTTPAELASTAMHLTHSNLLADPQIPSQPLPGQSKNDNSNTRFALDIADIALCLPYKTSPLAISPARGFYPDECACLPLTGCQNPTYL